FSPRAIWLPRWPRPRTTAASTVRSPSPLTSRACPFARTTRVTSWAGEPRACPDRWQTGGDSCCSPEVMVRAVEPEVHLIARPDFDYDEVAAYLKEVGGESWLERVDRGELDDAQNLAEFAGRICYRSWEPGLNPNVSRVRTDQAQYLQNILSSAHGSVLEHVNFSFVLHNVSRVTTHELVRHRAGVAVSQESLRFVRLDDLPFWFPEWARADPELMRRATDLLEQMEQFQGWMAEHFGLDDEGV